MAFGSRFYRGILWRGRDSGLLITPLRRSRAVEQRGVRFVEIGDAYTTGSSLSRKRKIDLDWPAAGRVVSNLVPSHNPQGTTAHLQQRFAGRQGAAFRTVDTVELSAAIAMLLIPRERRAALQMDDPNLLATDLVDWLVLQGALPQGTPCDRQTRGLAEQKGKQLMNCAQLKVDDHQGRPEGVRPDRHGAAHRDRQSDQIRERLDYWTHFLLLTRHDATDNCSGPFLRDVSRAFYHPACCPPPCGHRLAGLPPGRIAVPSPTTRCRPPKKGANS